MKSSLLKGVVLAFAVAVATIPAAAQRHDGIAAIVNDEIVLESEVDEQLSFLLGLEATPDSAMVDTLRRQVLNQLIDEKLIVAEAKRQGMAVGDEEVDRQVDEAVLDARQRMGSEAAFQDQLRRENLTEAQLRQKYREEVRRQLLAQRLVQRQLPRKTVTLSEAEAYFKAHHDKFPRVPSEIRLQVIQIPASPDSARLEEARKKTLGLRKQILDGAKFARVAAEHSEDPGTARSGGDLGFLEPGTMDPSVEAVVFNLKVGELSQPVKSPFGWHIVEVLDRDTVKAKSGKDSTDAAGKPVVEVHARHILIRTPVREADVERARSLADRVRIEAARGTNFGTLVRRYSKYEGEQGEDGDLGFVSMGTLQPNIRAGLDTLEVGEISEVLTTPLGFNIFKVTDRKPERKFQLEEIRDDLPEVVGQMKQRESYEEWVKGLRAKAHIEIRSS